MKPINTKTDFIKWYDIFIDAMITWHKLVLSFLILLGWCWWFFTLDAMPVQKIDIWHHLRQLMWNVKEVAPNIPNYSYIWIQRWTFFPHLFNSNVCTHTWYHTNMYFHLLTSYSHYLPHIKREVFFKLMFFLVTAHTRTELSWF